VVEIIDGKQVAACVIESVQSATAALEKDASGRRRRQAGFVRDRRHADGQHGHRRLSQGWHDTTDVPIGSDLGSLKGLSPIGENYVGEQIL
jgi:hypothetical protein